VGVISPGMSKEDLQLKAQIFVSVANALVGSCPVRLDIDKDWIAQTAVDITDKLHDKYKKKNKSETDLLTET